MSSRDELARLILEKSRRVPLEADLPSGDGAKLARQFDVALMSVGFKASTALLERLNGTAPRAVQPIAERALRAARKLVGDGEHNPYFIRFPRGVPDTVDFWWDCIRQALGDPERARGVRAQLRRGVIDLLRLPSYGRVQHSYEELLAQHEDHVPGIADRMTILDAGGPLEDEAAALLGRLAASPVPLNESDRDALSTIAQQRPVESLPTEVPVREHRAVLDAIRVRAGVEPTSDTVTDVLRLACALSDGDVTLVESTRFRSFPRRVRRTLLRTLDRIVAQDEAKLGDVRAHGERWKRLGERLHAGEYAELASARAVFEVARGQRHVDSLAARTEDAFAREDTGLAIATLSVSPGTLVRSVDRIVRRADGSQLEALEGALTKRISKVSGRVLLQWRQHLLQPPGTRRLFINRIGRAWSIADDRDELDEDVVARFARMADAEIERRLPSGGDVVLGPGAETLALPLSQKTRSNGFGVLPRGSVTEVTGDRLRFFIHWKDARWPTDLDLSVDLLDCDLNPCAHLSWTSLKGEGAVHSGDVTQAPDGAFEAIDLVLDELDPDVYFIAPSVHLYSGEPFPVLAESLFGYMTRNDEQKGLPFEPRTVRAKSDLRGTGRVAVPMVFERTEHGWIGRWIDLYLGGRPRFNVIEETRAGANHLVAGILERRVLTVGWLVERMRPSSVTRLPGAGTDAPSGATYIGLERPEDASRYGAVITPEELATLIPE